MKNTNLATVVGGLTMDLSVYVDSFPRAHRSLDAKSYKFMPGGKGLNQAITMSKMGMDVQIIATVGDDIFADQIMQFLNRAGIDGSNIIIKKHSQTDVIGIIITPDGEPTSIGTKTTGFNLSSADLEKRTALIKRSKVLMVNFEVPPQVARVALKIAKHFGVTTILNPAPPDLLPGDILKLVDFLVVNEWEAKVLSDNDQKRSGIYYAKKYHYLGAAVTCVTLGEKGCVLATNHGIKLYDAYRVDVKDATGAGDTFCGAVAYGIYKGFDLDKTIRFALAAAALTCTRVGASASIPTVDEVNNFIMVD